MQTVRYENSKGEYIDFGITPPYILQRITGTGEVQSNAHTHKSPFQDGRTYLKSTLEPREIYMQIAILTVEGKGLFEKREHIHRVFNPKLGEGTLTYNTPNGSYKIRGVVEMTPSFSEYKGNSVTCQVSLLCNDPFWYSITEDSYDFNAPYVPMFEFPFFSDPTNEIEFGYEQEQTTVFNEGTAYTPLIIEFDGGIKNATLTNLTTGEYITINKELFDGETLIIDTSFGKRKINVKRIDGTTENGFKYMTLDSKFLQLVEGSNDIKYVAEADGNVTVRLRWTTRYLGL